MVHSLGIDNVLSGVRAVLARELSKIGYTQKDISEILGTSQAAVTLYSKDRRGRQLSKIIESNTDAHLVIENLIERLRQDAGGSKLDEKDLQKDMFPLILDAAYRIMRVISSPSTERTSISKNSKSIGSNSLTDALIERLREEQLAAQRNMALAVGTSDEIARTIFRQIASDSIRHSEIVSYFLSLQKDHDKFKPSSAMLQEEITQIEAMIKGEESATEQPIKFHGLDPALKLLLKSMDIDEEKHKILLKGLLTINKGRRDKHVSKQ